MTSVTTVSAKQDSEQHTQAQQQNGAAAAPPAGNYPAIGRALGGSVATNTRYVNRPSKGNPYATLPRTQERLATCKSLLSTAIAADLGALWATLHKSPAGAAPADINFNVPAARYKEDVTLLAQLHDLPDPGALKNFLHGVLPDVAKKGDKGHKRSPAGWRLLQSAAGAEADELSGLDEGAEATEKDDFGVLQLAAAAATATGPWSPPAPLPPPQPPQQQQVEGDSMEQERRQRLRLDGGGRQQQQRLEQDSHPKGSDQQHGQKGRPPPPPQQQHHHHQAPSSPTTAAPLLPTPPPTRLTAAPAAVTVAAAPAAAVPLAAELPSAEDVLASPTEVWPAMMQLLDSASQVGGLSVDNNTDFKCAFVKTEDPMVRWAHYQALRALAVAGQWKQLDRYVRQMVAHAAPDQAAGR